MALAAQLDRSLLRGDGGSQRSRKFAPDRRSVSRTPADRYAPQRYLVPHLQLRLMRGAVVSDTHGLLRPEVLPALHGAEQILHLGDLGDPSILKMLEKIAP